MHSSLETSPSSPLHVPAKHRAGVKAPSMQKLASGHSLHAEAPSSSWYEPASQALQAAMLMSGATEPGEHGSGAALPLGHAWPTVHGVQSDSATSPGCAPYVPAGHAVSEGLPVGQKVPAAHSVDSTEAEPQNDPAGQTSWHAGPLWLARAYDDPSTPGLQANGKS